MKAYLTKWVPPRDDFLPTITEHEKALFQQHGDWQADLREQRLIVAHGPVIDPAGSYGVALWEVADDADIAALTADLTDASALEAVVERLRTGGAIDILVNNAGSTLPGGVVGADLAAMDRLLRLNVTAPTMLASVAATGMAARGAGAIVNIASALAFIPDLFPGIYSATKSYLLTFSRGLAAEVGPRGVYVQAVVPAATRTELWEHAGADVNRIPGVMDVDALVDAALVGFDRKEEVTIPAIHDLSAWEALEPARGVLASGFQQSEPAPRYRP